MPDSRSRSPPGRREERPRSQSPRRRNHDRPRRGGGGFKWKEKRTGDDERHRDSDRRRERGYRDRDRERERVNDRDRDRSHDRKREMDDERDRDSARVGEKAREQARECSGPNAQERLEGGGSDERRLEKPQKEKKAKKSNGPLPTAEPMIIVNINDRLGTKASIPCLASDPVKLFKAQVAARIGREPHEIMLKRQGERPFKDQLTLEDYGVSNGVQLDLEVDTGD